MRLTTINAASIRMTIAAVGAMVVLAACGGHGDEKKDDAPKSAQTVTATTVEQRNLPRIVTASGTVSAWEEVPVGAETGGLVAVGVYADEGSYVRQGQVLVKLNDTLLQAALRQQQASVSAAEANAEREAAELGRAQQLKERGYLSQASLDMAVSEERSARAQLEQARAGLSETRTRLEQTNIRAPVSGKIISRAVTRGQIVQPGTELFRMVRDGRLELDAQVPETELAMVRAGQLATVRSDQAGETTGRVRIVTPEVDPQTRLGIARISISGGTLQPGMFARADISVGDQPALVIPSEAIVYREGKAGVYVLLTDNTVRFAPIQTGARQNGLIEATQGLRAGQRVIVRGAGFLGEGDAVKIAPATPAAASASAPAATR